MQGEIGIYIEEALEDGGLCPSSAAAIMRMGDELLPLICYGAYRIRHHYRGKGVRLCAIVNAKSGRCPEDCAFCAQSAHHNTDIEVYPLLSPREIVRRGLMAKEMGARRFAIVTSGRGLSEGEIELVAEAIADIKESGLIPCASLGILTKEGALRLKEAGLNRYHHNLETAGSYFPSICTTHSYEESLNTLRVAKEVGLEVCSGGIFGLGETSEQRLELAYTLKRVEVDSVAINFLSPIHGTPLEGAPRLAPLELLKWVALFKFILPKAEIRICGGRGYALRELHPLVFWAGADGVMIGDYLTTKGRDPRADFEMIGDLGLEVVDG